MALLHSRAAAALALTVLPGLMVGTGAGWSIARMTSVAAVAGNSFTTAASFDTVAPTVSTTVISKNGAYFGQFIRQGGTYYVYANATDGGVSPTGIATITANVSAITTGTTAAPLVAGSWSVQGVAYGYRSAALAANASLTAGSKTYSLTSTDNNTNARTQSGYTVTVDNSAPTATDIQCVNGGATAGRIELGDICTFTFSELIDPESILAGWTGGATSMVVRFTNNLTTDTFAIWNAGNTAQLPLGSVNTGADLVGTAATAGVSGTASSMALNAAMNTITITMGTVAGTLKTDSANHIAAWTPSTSAFDAAGNAMSGTAVNETGAGDKDF